jgi:N-acetylmuramic acid 6-phosphate etherase
MGKLGRLTSNWMAHVDATNKKLIDRSIRIVSELAGIDYETACYALFETIDETATWSEARRKTISPVAHTVERLAKDV